MSDTALELVATIPKSGHAEIRIEVGTFKGREVVNVRVWCRASDRGGEFVPTKRGIMVDASKARALLAGMQAVVKKLGLGPT